MKVVSDIKATTIVDYPRFHTKDERRKSIRIKQNVTGLKDGQFAILAQLDHAAMRYPDGNRLETSLPSPRPLESEFYNQAKFMNSLRSALGEQVLLNPFSEDFSDTEIFNLTEDQFNQFKGLVGEYHALAAYDIYQYELRYTILLKGNQRTVNDSEEILILDVLRRQDGITVLLDEKKIRLLIGEGLLPVPIESAEQGDQFGKVYVLRNAVRKQAFIMEPTLGIKVFWPYSQRLTHTIKRIDFLYKNDRNEDLPVIDEGWLKDAELVRMDARKIGSQKKDIVYKNFYLPGRSTDRPLRKLTIK